MARYKKLVLLAAAGVLGFSTQAAAQKCAGDTCTGTVTFVNGASGAVLIKVTAKDVSPINPLQQNISVQVCGATGLSAVVARTASPKDVFKCTTLGSVEACTARPEQKSPTASSDSVVVTLISIIEASGRFTIRSEAWDEMKVQVLATADAVVSFPPGTVHCF